MSDPIEDIIYKALYNETSPRPMLAESTAKQIRQQIGRELLEVDNLEVNFDGDDTVKADIIREVCNMLTT